MATKRLSRRSSGIKNLHGTMPSDSIDSCISMQHTRVRLFLGNGKTDQWPRGSAAVRRSRTSIDLPVKRYSVVQVHDHVQRRAESHRKSTVYPEKIPDQHPATSIRIARETVKDPDLEKCSAPEVSPHLPRKLEPTCLINPQSIYKM